MHGSVSVILPVSAAMAWAPIAVERGPTPHRFDLLHHDITTMCTWFTRRGITTDPEALFADLLAKAR